MRWHRLLFLCGLLWTSSADLQGYSPYFQSGDQLYDHCSTGPDAYCMGYVAGETDTLTTYRFACLPPNATVREAVDIVMNFLRAHPETRHYSAASDVAVALKDAIPCK